MACQEERNGAAAATLEEEENAGPIPIQKLEVRFSLVHSLYAEFHTFDLNASSFFYSLGLGYFRRGHQKASRGRILFCRKHPVRSKEGFAQY